MFTRKGDGTGGGLMAEWALRELDSLPLPRSDFNHTRVVATILAKRGDGPVTRANITDIVNDDIRRRGFVPMSSEQTDIYVDNLVFGGILERLRDGSYIIPAYVARLNSVKPIVSIFYVQPDLED